MRIIPYTPKSFAVIGDTYPHKESLKAMHGSWCNLRVDNDRVGGWVFSTKWEVHVRLWLNAVANPAPTVDKAKQPSETKKQSPKRGAKPAVKAQPKATVEKVELPCSKDRVAKALSGEPLSAHHWAMRHILEFGLRPEDVARGTGLFGKDRNGKGFGEAERRSIFWMLNGNSPATDLAIHEHCPEFLRSQIDEQSLWDIVTTYAGKGGKGEMIAACIKLVESDIPMPW